MPAISFSGVTSRGPFWRQIAQGSKTQTCRNPRKRPIKKGATLYLYWKQRTPIDKKQVHFIGIAVRTNEPNKTPYRDFMDDDEFAKRDGFKNSAELRQWFGPYLDTDILYDSLYDVIQFNTIRISAEVIRSIDDPPTIIRES